MGKAWVKIPLGESTQGVSAIPQTSLYLTAVSTGVRPYCAQYRSSDGVISVSCIYMATADCAAESGQE